MNLCTGTLLAAALAAIGIAFRLAALRSQGVRFTLPVQRHNGHKRPEALHSTHIEYEDWS